MKLATHAISAGHLAYILAGCTHVLAGRTLMRDEIRHPRRVRSDSALGQTPAVRVQATASSPFPESHQTQRPNGAECRACAAPKGTGTAGVARWGLDTCSDHGGTGERTWAEHCGGLLQCPAGPSLHCPPLNRLPPLGIATFSFKSMDHLPGFTKAPNTCVLLLRFFIFCKWDIRGASATVPLSLGAWRVLVSSTRTHCAARAATWRRCSVPIFATLRHLDERRRRDCENVPWFHRNLPGCLSGTSPN